MAVINDLTHMLKTGVDAGIIADFLVERCADPSDVCWWYARDTVACAGLRVQYRCPSCGDNDFAMTTAWYLHGLDENQADCMKCEWRGRAWECEYQPALRLTVAFPMELFAEWAARAYDRARWAAVHSTLKDDHVMRPDRVRARKRDVLALFPDVTRTLSFTHDETNGTSAWDSGMRHVGFVTNKGLVITARRNGNHATYVQTIPAKYFVPSDYPDPYNLVEEGKVPVQKVVWQ